MLKGFSTLFFADFAGLEWQARPFQKSFSPQIYVVPLYGKLILSSDRTYSYVTLQNGKYYSIPFEEAHSIFTEGPDPSLWFYAIKRPHGLIMKGFSMD
jgi:hypothetical protein